MKAPTIKHNSYLKKLKSTLGKMRDAFRILREDKDFLVMTFLARFVCVREWVGRHSKPSLREDYAAQSSCISFAESSKSCMDAMTLNGYSPGLNLTSEIIQELLNFAFISPCYGNRDRKNILFISSREVANNDFKNSTYKVADYSNNIEECKAILRLKSDPLILALARQYIGHEPVYYRSELLWTFPDNPLAEIVYTQYFHCDINDYRNLKFFFYLTDVNSDSSPHSYIKGSHRHRSLYYQVQGGAIYPDREHKLIEFYGKDKVTDICGPLGSGFMGDPYCYHRGGNSNSNARLLLQMEFGSRDYKSCQSHHR